MLDICIIIIHIYTKTITEKRIDYVMDTMTFIVISNSLAFCLSIGLMFTIFNKGDLNKNMLVFTLLAFVEMMMGEYMQYFSIFLSMGIIIFYFIKSLGSAKEVEFHSVFLGIVPVFLVLNITNTIAYFMIIIFNPDFYSIFYNLSVGIILLLTCIMLYHFVFYMWDIEFNLSKPIEIFITLMVLICMVYQHIKISTSPRTNAALHLIFVGVVCLIIVCGYFLMKSEKVIIESENFNRRFCIEELIIENELKCSNLLNASEQGSMPLYSMGLHSLYDVDVIIQLLVERVKKMNQMVGNDNVVFDIAVLPTMPKKILFDIYVFFTLSLGFCYYDIHPVSKCKAFTMSVIKQHNNLFVFSIVYEGEREFNQSDFKNWLSFAENVDNFFLSDEEIVGIRSTEPLFLTNKTRVFKQELRIEWKEKIC